MCPGSDWSYDCFTEPAGIESTTPEGWGCSDRSPDVKSNHAADLFQTSQSYTCSLKKRQGAKRRRHPLSLFFFSAKINAGEKKIKNVFFFPIKWPPEWSHQIQLRRFFQFIWCKSSCCQHSSLFNTPTFLCVFQLGFDKASKHTSGWWNDMYKEALQNTEINEEREKVSSLLSRLLCIFTSLVISSNFKASKSWKTDVEMLVLFQNS